MQKGANTAFPLIIKKGHASVKIYRVENRGKKMFTVSYRSPAGRQRRMFADLEAARREANTVAANLAGGDLEALKLTGRERQLYVAASEAIQSTGLTLDVVAREFVTAFDILGRDAIIEAARFYKAKAESKVAPIRTAEAVARFVAAKEAEGISPHYRKDLRLILEKGVGEHFQCNLSAIVPDDLRAYLNARSGGPVAKNNHRRLIVALFNFAKGAGWLPANESTAADALGTYRVKDKDVTIYTPEELSKLLNAADKEFLPWLVLIAFGGVRHQELHKGLAWEHLDLTEGTLIVPAAIAKTGRKRKIDLPSNLRAWLAPYHDKTGTIFAKDPDARIGKTATAAGITWKRNALRHSFGSYRMEATKNAGQVSLEMGNSPAVVMAHYFEIVAAEAAAAYWALFPGSSSGDEEPQ